MRKELCIESYEGAKLAKEFGYDSVELNLALNLGGLTPSIGMVRSITKDFDIDVICMIRNRPAGFLYSNEEYEAMLVELDILLEEDIAGIAFGFLTTNYEIDIDRTKEFVNRIHAKNKIAIFHRAFDNTKDYKKAIDDLVEAKVDRVLTSGQEKNAIEGIDKLIEILNYADGRIEIIAGAGLNSVNIKDFVKNTNIDYVHSSCKGYREDNTTSFNVSYKVFNNNKYQINDLKEVEEFARQLNETD